MSTPSQYLYKIQPTRLAMLTDGPTPAEESILSKHFAYLQDLTDKGTVLLAGRTLNTDASSFGIVIFQAESDEHAQTIMQNDPAVQENIMKAELYPYRVALLTQSEKG